MGRVQRNISSSSKKVCAALKEYHRYDAFPVYHDYRRHAKKTEKTKLVNEIKNESPDVIRTIPYMEYVGGLVLTRSIQLSVD